LALSAVARPNLAALPSPPRSSDIASARVLLVEDMVVNQEIARSMLESAGHHVDAVPDGLDAIMAVEARSYDVVLMDIQMPVMDGVTATRRIRGLPGPEKDVPIVAMTANVLPAQIESFRAAGMNGHVGKPIRREDLLKAVARFAPPASLAQVAPVRNSDSDAVLDADTFAEVTELLGHGKTNELLGRLRVQLTDQFPARAETTEELAKLAQEAHKFVSTAGMFGFQALSNSCARLEAAARGNHDDVADILAEAQAACRDTLAEIAVRLARPENAAKSA
jgi:CheY-like chemotaxis protein/HPt (histidine-containing phosphotransfer) domain-containing protein